jgi:hypothetical protein
MDTAAEFWLVVACFIDLELVQFFIMWSQAVRLQVQV